MEISIKKTIFSTQQDNEFNFDDRNIKKVTMMIILTNGSSPLIRPDSVKF